MKLIVPSAQTMPHAHDCGLPFTSGDGRLRANVAANFEFYSGFALTFLWISSLVMLILANALLWTNRSIWSLWTTFLYFAVFVLLNIFWLSELFFAYKKANGLTDGAFSLTGIFGAILCVVVGVGVFFD